MKAAVRYKYVDFSKIEVLELPKPQPKDDQIMVKVRATTVSRTDCALVNARPWIMRLVAGLFKPKKPILGTDFAGEIVAIGKDVTRFDIGDRVMGFNDVGISTQAEYVCISQDIAMTTIPDQLDYVEAVACIEGAHYAYTWIRKWTLTKDHKILLNGATGAIGSALLQYLKYYDVYVTAVCNTKNVELVKKLGADKVYDYEKEDFTKDEEKYDAVFDAVGKSAYGRCKHLLKPQGAYSSSELGPYIQNPFLALWTAKSKGKRVIFTIPTDVQASLEFAKKLATENRFKPVIEKGYPLSEVAAAYQYVSSGKKTGNVILNIS